MSKEIKLTKNKSAIVDDTDFEYLNQFKWHYNSRGYASRSVYPNNKVKKSLMHRVIMKLNDSKIYCDHINNDKLDNRKDNLRICNNAENIRNRSKPKTSNKKYKGVFITKGVKKISYRAEIRFNGKKYKSKVCNNEEHAALVYNELAKKYHGEFAKLNEVAV